MTIRLDIVVDVKNHGDRWLNVNVDFASDDPPPVFCFEMLLPRPGIQLVDLSISDSTGSEPDYSVNKNELVVFSRSFTINYSIRVDYSECVGVDRAAEFNFPFINSNEIYFSTGLIPFPENLHEIIDMVDVSLEVRGVPTGWIVFSSTAGGDLIAAKLDNFFWYATSKGIPREVVIKGREKDILIDLLLQQGKSFPATQDEFLKFISKFIKWIENNIAPYRQLSEIKILILQAPANYLELSQNTSFATGENVIHGILAYGPDDPANFRLLGSQTYRDYLFEGIAHEILHCYTTTAIQGKYKSVLYPSLDCPPGHARMIGESLNLYFVYDFVGKYFDESDRLKNQLSIQLARYNDRPRKNGLLDVYLLDQYLKSVGSSVLMLFAEMVKWKQEDTGPYSSGEFMFDTMKNRMQINPPNDLRDLILNDSVPDYVSNVRL